MDLFLSRKMLDSMTTSNNHKSAVAIKENITTLLKETVAQIVVASAESSIGENDGAIDLCAIIEAIFLNGLKDGFMNRFRRTLDVDQQCTLSFWNLLMEISHQENIKQVQKLSIIKTEVGQCRAWIRLVLNEALLSSYLKTIKENRKTLLRYYHNYAYLLDHELLDIARVLIEKVEAVTLTLPCNSGILNTWIDFPLSLAGIAYRPMRLNQITPGVDIAQSLQASSSRNSETCSIASSIISQSSGFGQIVSLNEDEALRLILKNHSENESSTETHDTSSPHPCIEQVQSNNILKGQSGWSFEVEDKRNEKIDADLEKVTNEPEVQNEVEERGKILLERSYSSIVHESNFLDSPHIKTPDFRDVLQGLGSGAQEHENSLHIDDKTENDKVNDVKVDKIETVLDPSPSPTKTESLFDQVTKLGNERGLDSQDYKCNACLQLLSINNKQLCCSFSGNYYCDTCMSKEEIAIPARIIFNWDYKKYAVSQRAFNILEEVKNDPLIDFKIVNPYIYTAIEEMARLQTLRNQLNYLRAYLYTCREPVIEQLQKMMFPREYMYEHIHQYSISDLLEIKDGVLADQLQKVVQFGREHVLNCWLCSQKGFVCEICNDSKPLFPFDTDSVYRCNECSGVSHKSCLNANKPCPRCDRKHKRDLPLQEATINMD